MAPFHHNPPGPSRTRHTHAHLASLLSLSPLPPLLLFSYIEALLKAFVQSSLCLEIILNTHMGHSLGSLLKCHLTAKAFPDPYTQNPTFVNSGVLQEYNIGCMCKGKHFIYIFRPSYTSRSAERPQSSPCSVCTQSSQTVQGETLHTPVHSPHCNLFT